MTAIARGIDRETLKKEPSIITVVNTNSPLRVDGSMLDGLIEMAENGQPTIVTPFTLSGAMCPITIAGCVGATKRRGARSNSTVANRQSGSTDGLWWFYFKRRHAHRSTGIWYP